MTVVTDDERRAQYIGAMGQLLGDLYHDLENEAAYLLHKWDEFDVLFNDEEGQLELLNRVAPNFFYRLRQRWYEDAMLHISRLTDPAESGGRSQANVTIRRLPQTVVDPSLRAMVEAAVAAALARCAFARRWRDKRLAHGALEFSRRSSLASLPQATKAGVRDAIAAICGPLRIISEHYGHSPALDIAKDQWGARALLLRLRRPGDVGCDPG